MMENFTHENPKVQLARGCLLGGGLEHFPDATAFKGDDRPDHARVPTHRHGRPHRVRKACCLRAT